MTVKLTIDRITDDPIRNEIVLYLVEDGPWPAPGENLAPVLKRIQDRILYAVDAAVDGHLVPQFPDSVGRAVRIQVDSPSHCPPELRNLIDKVSSFLGTDPEYADAIRSSPHISGLRVVTGHEMGRFRSDRPVA